MFDIKFKTSQESKRIISELTYRLPFSVAENFTARVAILYSFYLGHKVDLLDTPTLDSKGKEFRDSILFDPSIKDVFVALLIETYPDIQHQSQATRIIKEHLDHGLNALEQNSAGWDFLDFLMSFKHESAESTTSQ